MQFSCLPSHHDCKDVLGSGLIVQPVCRVHNTCARIHPEQPHAGRVYAAVDGEAQTGALVQVRCSDPQQLQVDGRVFRNADIIGWLREDRRVVIAVLYPDEHLR